MSNNSQKFKIALLGDGGVGKSTFLKRYTTKEFDRKYTPTTGWTVEFVDINFDIGHISFEILDVAGQRQFQGPSEAPLAQADAALLMFDVTSEITYINIPKWYDKLLTATGPCDSDTAICRIPVVLCGNKVDITERMVAPEMITISKEKQMQYYDVSVRTLQDLHEPLRWLARRLTGNDSITYMLPKPTSTETPGYSNTHE